jgi:V/A-type H+-transporting ATPase subunit D
MDQVSATRSELLARRAIIRLAAQGRDVLRHRRGALIGEFHRMGPLALESLVVVDRDAAGAGQVLGLSIGADGREPLESAAMASETGTGVAVRTRSVAGVPIVELDRGKAARASTGRGYSLAATSAHIDAVAERFEAVLDRLLDLAALELSVRRLAGEIARTTRRMNALEYVVMPRLQAERAHIALALDEREMEDRIRLRRGRSTRKRETGLNSAPACSAGSSTAPNAPWNCSPAPAPTPSGTRSSHAGSTCPHSTANVGGRSTPAPSNEARSPLATCSESSPRPTR